MENETVTKKKIGILGGMGPDATVYLCDLLIKLTEADKDQQHIKTIVYNNPEIPDRTEAILNGGESPLNALTDGARTLEQAGADFILMPCVTAHYFLDSITPHISIPFIHLLDVVLHHILTHPVSLKRIGLIATSGTIETRLFQDLLEKHGLEVVIPDERGRNIFMEAVYGERGVKAGYIKEPKLLLLQVLEQLRERNIQAVIAGCTEVPLVLGQGDMDDVHYINPLRIMAEEGIRRAGYTVKRRKS